MPYNSLSALPDSVKKNLPKRAREIFLAAYNSAWEQYAKPKDRRGDDTREETAHKVAWAAVKKKYRQKNDKWVLKKSARVIEVTSRENSSEGIGIRAVF